MLNRFLTSIIFFSLLVVAFVIGSPAQAQMIDEVQQAQNVPAVVAEHASRSGWEKPLVQRDHNLKHFYWTEIDRNKAAYHVINRTGNQYNVVSRNADNKPKVVHVSTRNLLADLRGANNDVSGSIRPIVAQSRPQAAVYSYSSNGSGNGYGSVAPSYSSAQSSGKQVKARLMTY